MNKDRWWNTSGGLKKSFPGIERASCWQKFAQTYDRAECVSLRRRKWDETYPARKTPDGSLDQLVDLAFRATGRFALSHLLARIGDDIISKEKAGETLGKIVLDLIGDRGKFDLLAHQIRLRDEKPEKRCSNIADAIEAFIQFLRRENRLPTNKEIRIEANRIKFLEYWDWVEGETYEFGQFLRKGQRSYRVCMLDFDANLIGVVPKLKWDEPRWDGKDFSVGITTPAGFSGLPRR